MGTEATGEIILYFHFIVLLKKNRVPEICKTDIHMN